MDNLAHCSCGKPLTDCEQRVAAVIRERDEWRRISAEQQADYGLLQQQLEGAVDPIRETRIARACGLAQAIVECHDDARLDSIRETAAEIVTLLEGYIK